MAHLIELSEIHIRRLFRIARALSTRRGMNVPQIAKRFRVSVRTAFREINVLRDLDVGLESEDGVHRVTASAAALRRRISTQCHIQVDDMLKRSLR